MPSGGTLTTRSIPGVHTAHVWLLTVDTDSSGNVAAFTVPWDEMMDAPSQWQAAIAFCCSFGTSANTNSGSFHVVIDHTNRVFRITGRGFPASQTNIPAMLIAW